MDDHRRLSDIPKEEREIVGSIERENYSITLYKQTISDEQWDKLHLKVAEMIYNQAIEA